MTENAFFRLTLPLRFPVIARRCMFAVLVAVALCAQSLTPAPQQPSWLLNRSDFITEGDLPSHFASTLKQMGARMTGAGKGQVILDGTITDGRGSRSAQLVIQSPGYLAYREGLGRAVAFDGAGFQTKTGAPTADDDAISESLLAHFPDTICLQLAAGGSYRRIGTHFRVDGSKGGNYTGPYWTVYAFSPTKRPGLTAGKALQQELFIAIDERTGFISEVRIVVNSALRQQRVTQTQFENWTQHGDQWFPGKITRIEDGKQVLAFQVLQAGVAAAGPATLFKP